VSDRGMEIEVRESEGRDVLLALQRHRGVRTGGEGDLPDLAALELRRLERLYIIDGLRQPLAQFLERRLRIRGYRRFVLRQAGASFCGKIAGDLDLLAERQHVRIEPRADQNLRLDVFCLAMRLGLGEQAAQAVKDLQEGRNGGVVEGHGDALSVGEKQCCSTW